MNGMKPKIANRAAEAMASLNASGIEIIRTDGGYIVRDANSGAYGHELTCDSDAELVHVARRVRDLRANAPRESVVVSLGAVRGSNSSSQAGSRRAGRTDSAPEVRLVKNKMEVSKR